MLKIFGLLLNFFFVNFLYAQILNENPGFESGSYTDEWRPAVQNTNDALIEIVTNPVRSGKYALHLQHQFVDGSTHNRCEIVPLYQLGTWTTKNGYTDWNREYWLGFSVYLENWEDSLRDWNSIVQNHSVPNDYN